MIVAGIGCNHEVLSVYFWCNLNLGQLLTWSIDLCSQECVCKFSFQYEI